MIIFLLLFKRKVREKFSQKIVNSHTHKSKKYFAKKHKNPIKVNEKTYVMLHNSKNLLKKRIFWSTLELLKQFKKDKVKNIESRIVDRKVKLQELKKMIMLEIMHFTESFNDFNENAWWFITKKCVICKCTFCYTIYNHVFSLRLLIRLIILCIKVLR